MKKDLSLIFLLVSSLSTFSQNLTLSPNTLTLPNVPNPSQISNPDKGAVVYNSTDNKVYYKDNVDWKNLSTASTEAVNPNPVSVYLYSVSPKLASNESSILIKLESAVLTSHIGITQQARTSSNGNNYIETRSNSLFFDSITLQLSDIPSILGFFNQHTSGEPIENIELRYYMPTPNFKPSELILSLNI